MAIGNMNITLTAHVLITLEETSPVLQVNFYNCRVFTVLQVKTLSSKLKFYFSILGSKKIEIDQRQNMFAKTQNGLPAFKRNTMFLMDL